MLFRLSILLYTLCIIGLQPLQAQQEELELVEKIKNSSSYQRIKAIADYCQENIDSRGRTPEKFDLVFKACNEVADRDNDIEFKLYLDHYDRVKASMFVSHSEIKESEKVTNLMWQEALHYYTQSQDKRFMAICHAHLSGSYFAIDQYDKTVEHLLKADEIFQQVGYETYPMIGRYLHDMSLLFYFFRDYKKVIELLEISISLPPHDNNKDVQRYNTLGAAHKHLKNYTEGEKAFQKAISIARNYRDSEWIGIASWYLANLYIEQNEFQKAIDSLENTLQFTFNSENDNKHNRTYANHLLGLARAYIGLRNYSKAQFALKKVIYQQDANPKKYYSFGKNHQNLLFWTYYYETYHQYYLGTKDYYNAYNYLDSTYQLKYLTDSTFNNLQIQVAQNRIQVQKEQFQNEEQNTAIQNRTRLITILTVLMIVIATSSFLIFMQSKKVKSQNAFINEQLQVLQRILNQKQVLLKELQHRVKNNLQHVISLLEIQKESVNIHTIEEVIRENQNRIHSMALLHSRLNSVDDIQTINLRHYLEDLCSLVEDSYQKDDKEINLLINCQIEFITIEKALPIGMIIVELMSNSFKHAFSDLEKGVIDIQIQRSEDSNNNILSYKDNGKGFDLAIKEHKGLGIEIIRGLADQLHGTIEEGSKEGYHFQLTFE
jgi:two-component sensor histidine kinase